MRDLASQAGLVLRNVRLIEELRASRQRLVAAQDEERRKLERNIHDGAQQQLVALTVKLRLARAAGGRATRRRRREIAAQLQDETRDGAGRPPRPRPRDLPAAARGQGTRTPRWRRRLGRLPVPVIGGCRRCRPLLPGRRSGDLLLVSRGAPERDEVRGGLAGADLAHSEQRRLSFAVTDDGVGFDPASATHGTGLQGIADRLGRPGRHVRHREHRRRGHGGQRERADLLRRVRRRRARPPRPLPDGRVRRPTWGCRRRRRTRPRAARTPPPRTSTGAARRRCSRYRPGSGVWRRGR